MSARSLPSVLALVAAAGVLLFAGCAASTPTNAPAPGETTAAPTDAPPAELDVDATWLDGGRAVGILTWGSSTCVPTAQDVTQGADGSVSIELGAVDPMAVCTADYAPRVTLASLPPEVDATAGLDLVVTLDGARDDVDLDPYAGPDVPMQTPSAGWIDDGMFAILTWGSSSCAPVIDRVEKTSATEVSVVFASNGESACTDDLAARAVLASVEGVDDDVAVTATLSGHDFATAVAIPIS